MDRPRRVCGFPERHLPVAPEPAVAAGCVLHPEAAPRLVRRAARAPRPGRGCGHGEHAASRDLSGVRPAPPAGWWRRAPEVPAAVAGASAPARGWSASRSGGPRDRASRRARLLAALRSSASGARGADPAEQLEAPPHGAAFDDGTGRRSPPTPGRHRKADTGPLPGDQTPRPRSPSRLPRRARLEDTFGGRSRSAWAGLVEQQPDLLTRPMRLSDQALHARRPRLDGSLTGV